MSPTNLSPQAPPAELSTKATRLPAIPSTQVPQALSAHNRVRGYALAEEIGRGSFARVYRAYSAERGCYFALKVIPLRGNSPDEVEHIAAEVSLLQRLRHPQIVRLHDSFQANGSFHIVLELLDASAAATVRRFGTFSEATLRDFIRQLLRALDWCHSSGVAHRDVKGANVLLKDGRCLLADFGSAIVCSDSTKEPSSRVVGTAHWLAPEVIHMAEPTSAANVTAADIWALACTTIELLTGRPPYHELHPEGAIYHIAQELPPIPPGISSQLNDFLGACFARDPADRPTAAQLLQHPWIEQTRAPIPVTRARHVFPPSTSSHSSNGAISVHSISLFHGSDGTELSTMARAKSTISRIRRNVHTTDGSLSETFIDSESLPAHAAALSGRLWKRAARVPGGGYRCRLFRIDGADLTYVSPRPDSQGSRVRRIPFSSLRKVRIVSETKLEVSAYA